MPAVPSDAALWTTAPYRASLPLRTILHGEWACRGVFPTQEDSIYQAQGDEDPDHRCTPMLIAWQHGNEQGHHAETHDRDDGGSLSADCVCKMPEDKRPQRPADQRR